MFEIFSSRHYFVFENSKFTIVHYGELHYLKKITRAIVEQNGVKLRTHSQQFNIYWVPLALWRSRAFGVIWCICDFPKIRFLQSCFVYNNHSFQPNFV